MDKKNVLVLLILALVVLLLGTAMLVLRPSGEANEVLILVDGREYARVPLLPRTITIDQGDGRVNVITVSTDGAEMTSSTCENQLCVHSGKVSTQNWEFRPDQQWIICLPNRVSVELVVKE